MHGCEKCAKGSTLKRLPFSNIVIKFLVHTKDKIGENDDGSYLIRKSSNIFVSSYNVQFSIYHILHVYKLLTICRILTIINADYVSHALHTEKFAFYALQGNMLSASIRMT